MPQSSMPTVSRRFFCPSSKRIENSTPKSPKWGQKKTFHVGYCEHALPASCFQNGRTDAPDKGHFTAPAATITTTGSKEATPKLVRWERIQIQKVLKRSMCVGMYVPSECPREVKVKRFQNLSNFLSTVSITKNSSTRTMKGVSL